MKLTKLTSAFALMAMVAGVAVAQPPPPGPDGERPARGERRGDMRRGGDAGPFAKLMAASKLASLTPEQKAKVDALLAEKKPQADALREEMRTAMQAARDSTDREARRAAMEPLRAKHEAAQKEIDAALGAILTPEQMTELNQKAGEMREGMRERFGRRGGPDDAATTASEKADWGKKNKGDKKKGEGKGKKGNTGHKADSASTGTATVTPFSE